MALLSTNDLKCIVPAMQPAWIHAFSVWKEEREEDGNPDGEGFCDCVVPVLAYATAPDGYGAYLIAKDDSGPLWLRHAPFRNKRNTFGVQLHVGTKPELVDKCPFHPDAIRYETDDVFDDDEAYFFFHPNS